MNRTRLLTYFAMILLVAAFFSPIWWVSLTAPNYPQEAFPDGIKIHFYFSGVQNGCKLVKSARSHEIYQGDLGDNPSEERANTPKSSESGINCVHEMDTINHYVGMYPIVTGAPIEQAYSKYIFGIMMIMLFAFSFVTKRAQLTTLMVGFVGVSVWLVYTQLFNGGIDHLVQIYQTELGTYFKGNEHIEKWSQTLRSVAHITVYALLGLMIVSILGVFISQKIILVFPLASAFLPLYFIADFGGWLWFFGHNLHPWGAFTLKPFMPTVFGEGKVAQFSTYSYPHFGFLFLVLAMICLLLAFLIRRKAMNQTK